MSGDWEVSYYQNKLIYFVGMYLVNCPTTLILQNFSFKYHEMTALMPYILQDLKVKISYHQYEKSSFKTAQGRMVRVSRDVNNLSYTQDQLLQSG